MQQATDLIGGLGRRAERWTEDSAKFDATKTALVGDVAVGCAFVSYCGPFNQEFRDYIVEKKLTADLKKKDVPCSPSLDVISCCRCLGNERLGSWQDYRAILSQYKMVL